MKLSRYKYFLTALLLFTSALYLKAQLNHEYLVTVNTTTGSFTTLDSMPGVRLIQATPPSTGFDEVHNRYFFVGVDTGSHGYLYTIDANTGRIFFQVTPQLLNVHDNFQEMEYDDSTQTLYTLYTNTALAKNFLASINYATGAFTMIDSLAGGISFQYTYDQVHHRYVFCSNTTLTTLNALTGQLIYNPVISYNLRNIQYDAATNTLYGSTNNGLYIISQVTGDTIRKIYNQATVQNQFPSYDTFNDSAQVYTMVTYDSTPTQLHLRTIDTGGHMIYYPLFPEGSASFGFSNTANVIELKYNNRNHVYYALHWGPAQGCSANAQWTSSAVGNDSVWFQGPAMVDGVNYSWSFGDGATATASTDIIHQYAFPGSYTVCLRSYQSDTTGCADSLCRVITVLGTCPTSAAWTKTILTADSVHFVAQDTVTAATHFWDFGDSTTASGTTNITHVFPGPGTYTICFYSYSYVPGTSCSDTLCQAVTVTDPYNCTINKNWSYHISANHEVDFQAQDTSSQASLIWNFGDGNTGLGNAPAHTYTLPGNYIVCLHIHQKPCTDSLCQPIDIVLGIPEFSIANSGISIAPNPFDVYTKISINGSTAPYELYVYDILGKQLRQDKANGNTFIINREGLSPGIYFYTVKLSGQTIGSGKVVAR